jgi:hypothetical protein
VRALILLTIMLASLAACRDQGPELPTFTGHWAGFAETGFNVEITASERGGEVVGGGTFSGGQQPTVAFSVTGVHLHPEVMLIIRASGFADVKFSGVFDGQDRVAGRLDGAGFNNTSLTLGRQ